jgi:signal transduction histidine kinase/DNA-binding response OmpR family regulator
MGDSADTLRRRRRNFQRKRFEGYTLCLFLAAVLKLTGAMAVSWEAIGILYGLAVVSVVFFRAIYSASFGDRINLDVLWFVADLFMTMLGVLYTGGLSSPWYLFFLCNTLSVAFVAGRRWAIVNSLLSIVVYGGLAWYLSNGDRAAISAAVGRMLILQVAYYIAFSGIEELKRKRDQVKRLRDDEARKVAELTRLTQALDERTQALADANVKIREADRLKSQFLANMSHELRTPLNSIIGFSEILSTRLAETLSPKHARFLGNIHSSGTHLLQLINDILDLSKIEAGKMDLHAEPLQLRALVEGVVGIMRGMANERGTQFEIDFGPGELPVVEGDGGRLKQILYNLLSNAVKFSPERSTVRVVLRALDAAKSPLKVDSLELAVIDQGIGIDPKNHELVFQEFRQVDGGAAREFQGTGLGLALVKKFIELHRGRIAVESQLGQGAKFIVTLPRKWIGAGKVAPPVPTLPTGARPLVLVVEDDPTAYETIHGELAKGEFRAMRARHGDEALGLARTLRPSAITLDLVLPGMSGWDVLKRLKEEPETRDIPVIIISMIENRELGLALGADDYFVKPIDGTALLRRVHQLLPSDTRRRRVLLIDDDPHVHDMLDAALGLEYTVEHASSGEQGLEQANTAPPDLIILDLMMEGMDGFEVATRIKGHSSTAHVPILVLTNKDVSKDDRTRLSGKIGALLQKANTSPSGLLHALHDLLSRESAHG